MIVIAKRTGIYTECDFCGKPIYKTLYQYNKNKHHFCSNKCQSQLKRKLSFEYRKCEICGKDFYVSKKSTQRFCSNECQHKWQIGNTGFKNPKFQGGYLICENCGKSYLVGKYILQSNRHHFCGLECKKSWYANVWSQSEEWKEESRKRAAEILSKNPIKTQTKPQIAVNNALDKLSIKYRNEEPFVYYSIDNYLIEYNLAIEVMGDYWHSSPIAYPNKINDKQRYIVSRDKAKNTFIKNQFGIDILYIWESDILNKPELCEALIRLYVSNQGKIPNYNSFNYHLDKSGNIKLNQDILYPRQESIHKIAC